MNYFKALLTSNRSRLAIRFSNRAVRFYLSILVALVAIGSGFLVGLKVITVYAQSNLKSVSLGPPVFSDTQLKIYDGKVGTKSLRFEEGFFESSDWVSKISFRLENVSKKSIVYARVNIWFPETTTSGPIMVYPLTFGKRPGSKIDNREPLLLRPEESMDVSFANEFTNISTFIGTRHSINSIQQIRLEINFLIFEDGTAWSVGTFMTRDPMNPNRYIPVKRPEETKP